MADDLLNQSLGKYRLLAELGRGGFATVYRALDTTLDRQVALKVLDPLLLRDPAWVTRFQREAKAVARLKHPHIVTIYEIGEAAGQVFIAMELIEGAALDRLIAQRGRLPWPETLDILAQVADALDDAHSQGIIHRDLKPANILLDPRLGAVLTDFGFARLVGESSLSVSLSGGVVGTPAYIAPEVWRDQGAGPATDLYALACIAYEMLQGQLLFPGTTPAAVMTKHVIDGPQLPARWPPGVPAGVAQVLSKALAREPAQRYANAGEMVAALRRAAAPGGPAAAVPSRKGRPPGWLWAAGAAALLGLVAVAILAGLWLAGRGGTPPVVAGPTPMPSWTSTGAPTSSNGWARVDATLTGTPTPPRTLTPLPPERSTTPTKPATSNVTRPTYTPEPSQAPALPEMAIGPIVFASGATADGKPVDPSDTFSGSVTEIHTFFSYQGMKNGMSWECRWYRNGNRVGGGSGRWDAGAQGAYHLSLNSGGQPLGPGDWKLEIYVADQLQQSGSFVVEAAAPSPTARPTPTTVTMPTVVSQTEVPPTPVPIAKVYKIVFARWEGGTHNLYVADTSGGRETLLLHRAAGPSWSPDGKFVAFYGEEGVGQQEQGGVQLAGITNGILYLNMGTWSADLSHAEVGQFVRERTGRWAAWAPDGTMVAFDAARGGPDRRIYFLGTADNQQYNVEIPGEQADWSPDSDRLVYRSGRDNQQGIWISNRDGSGSVNITTNGSDAFPRWSPDGRKIAFHRESDGNVDIYRMDVDGSNIRRFTDATGPDTLPAWTPNGRIVFRSLRSGSWGIYVMDADSYNQKQIIANADPGPDWSFGRMEVH
jgi:Tol biopolymer transport system component